MKMLIVFILQNYIFMKKIFDIILILLCITFLYTNTTYAESTYNDACWIENTSSWTTDLPYAKLDNTNNIAKTSYTKTNGTYFLNSLDSLTGAIYKENISFSFKNVWWEHIWDINSEIYNLEFLYKTWSVLYFKNHSNNNKVYNIDIANKQDFSLKLFNNTNNFLYLFSEWGYIYYKNPTDSYKIYKIKETCSDTSLSGYKITWITQNNYVFENWDYIYYRNSNLSNQLYKIKKDWTDLNNTWEKVSDTTIYNMKIDNISTWAYRYLFNDNDWVYLSDYNNKIYRLSLTFVPTTIISDIQVIETNNPELILDNNANFLIADENYIYYKKNIEGDIWPVLDWPFELSYIEEIYRIKKDWTNNELIYKTTNTLNSFDWEFTQQDTDYLYIQYWDFNMYTYKLKKDWTEFSKLFDINYPYSYLLDNGELYYFDENYINSFFRYRLDWTNDFYLKNDNIFESNEILLSTWITDININLDTTLENNTSYNFYIANKQIETVLFNENDDRIIVGQEWIYTDKLWINLELNNIVSNIKIWDTIILEKDGIKYYFQALMIHPDVIEFVENLNINPDIDLSWAKVSIYGNDYKQIDNTKLDWNSVINLANTLWENNWTLYYKIELFSDDLKTSPVVHSVEISEYKLNPPLNLKQYIKSPLVEKEEVYLWMKIWKFQSW